MVVAVSGDGRGSQRVNPCESVGRVEKLLIYDSKSISSFRKQTSIKSPFR